MKESYGVASALSYRLVNWTALSKQNWLRPEAKPSPNHLPSQRIIDSHFLVLTVATTPFFVVG